MVLRNRFLLSLSLLASSAAGQTYDTVQYQRSAEVIGYDVFGGQHVVFVHSTCDKNATGQIAGQLTILVKDAFGEATNDEEVDEYYDYCPTPLDLDSLLDTSYSLTTSSPLTSIGARPMRDAIEQTVTPASNRMYIADATGPRGRSSLDVLDVRTYKIIANIDIDDRLFAGLAVASGGQRTYALLYPATSSAASNPAYIAYIDNATNRVVDRFLLPGLMEPQKPAISADGRFLYFAARTATLGQRIQIADLQTKTIVSTLPAAVPATVEPRASALSPDGTLLCSSAQTGLLCYDLRTRTYIGRVAFSVPNADLRPVFHPTGSRLYMLGRATLSTGSLSNFISVLDTATLTELTRIPILNPAPENFRDTLVEISVDPGGTRLFVDESFRGTLNIIDTRTNSIVRTITGLSTGGLASGFVLKP